MRLLSASTITTGVALLSSAPSTNAQSIDDNNGNLTLRFFTSSQTDSCSYANSSNALTFTTSTTPIQQQCFNIADLFGGNSTSGVINQTRNTQGTFATTQRGALRWQLENKDQYDPSANYSSLLYRQFSQSPSDGGDGNVGTFSSRRVNVYGGVNCTELDPTVEKDDFSKPLLPWFGFSCFTEKEGSCGDTPYNIASFIILTSDDEREGGCWDFAYMGAATAPGSRASMGGLFVSVLIGVWMAL